MSNLKILGLNFKAFKESACEKGLRLGILAEIEAAQQHGFEIIIFPQIQDTSLFCKSLTQTPRFKVFAQHANFGGSGAFTGWTCIENLKACGASGVLLNHAEHKLELKKLEELITAAKKFKLTTFVCADTIEEGKKIAKFGPDILAIEPPELIGKGFSVTSVNPKLVENAVKTLKKISKKMQVIVGAGISSEADLKAAIKLGADGVLLASAYVKSKDSKSFIEKMLASVRIK